MSFVRLVHTEMYERLKSTRRHKVHEQKEVIESELRRCGMRLRHEEKEEEKYHSEFFVVLDDEICYSFRVAAIVSMAVV